jgi:hypothetical protein
MKSIERPTKPFMYPGGKHMCRDGQIRATVYAGEVLRDEDSSEVLDMARRGDYALKRGADTSKANLIAHIVFFHFMREQLTDYANEKGDFVNNEGELDNLGQYEKVVRRFRKRE